MEVLSQIISQMDRHAVRHFKLFAGSSEVDESRKDLKYFDYLRRMGENANEEKIFKKLYPGQEGDKNAFYRLKNRLLQDLSTSIFVQEHERHDVMRCLYLLGLGYYYAGRGSHRVALHFFSRAEDVAQEGEHYNLLDVVYAQMIKLAREIVSINPEIYLRKRKENRNRLTRLSEMEDILEALEYRVKVTQNLAVDAGGMPVELQATLDEYTHDEELKHSPKLRLGIYFMISRRLLQQKDYVRLEEYLDKTFGEFQQLELFSKSNHAQKLQMLAWLANAAFMNRRHVRSLEYAELLHKEMERFDRLHYAAFEMFYYNALVINYSVINTDKAVTLLNRLITDGVLEKEPYYGVFIHLNLGVLYFLRQDFSKALQHLNKLYLHPGYESLDRGVRFRINMGELMIRHSILGHEALAYRSRQVRKDFSDLLTDGQATKESRFFDLLSQLTEDRNVARTHNFKEKVKEYVAAYEEEWNREELLFGYTDWLLKKAGIDRKSVG